MGQLPHRLSFYLKQERLTVRNQPIQTYSSITASASISTK